MSIKENKRRQRAQSLVNNKKLGYKMLIPATPAYFVHQRLPVIPWDFPWIYEL